jgi:hypothetical protein
MTITNKLNLPGPIVQAIQANWYGGGGEDRFASVTELIKPTKQFLLAKRHQAEIEQDASEMIWTLMGSALHKVVESADIDNAMQEERLAVSFDGERITGGFDLYHGGIVTDFKFTSVWGHIYGSRVREWTAQLNLYAYLLGRYGFEVEGIEVVAIFRDWNRHKAKADPSYPKPVERLRLDLWEREQAEAFLDQRIGEIRRYCDLPDDLIPACSPEERWESPDRFAVLKPGSVRALRVFDRIDEAQQFVREHKDADNLRVITRSDPPKRCLEFCPVNRFCHYYRSLVGQAGGEEVIPCA